MSASHVKAFISSLSTSNKGSNDFILKKVVNIFLQDELKSYRTEFIMGEINSKDIEKMLTLLENKDKKIRKLTLLVLTFLLQNGKSKIYFLEKCGLGLKMGKIFLSRLKYLTLNIKDMPASIDVLNEIIEKGVIGQSKEALFWYIPLIDRNKEPYTASQIDYVQFYVEDIKADGLGDIDIHSLPDPIYNLCGVDFDRADIQNSEIYSNAFDLSKMLDGSLTFEESHIISGRDESIKYSVNTSNTVKKHAYTRRTKADKSEDNKSQKSYTNTSQFSALKRPHLSPFKGKNKVRNKKLIVQVKKKKKDRASFKHNLPGSSIASKNCKLIR